MPVPGAATLTQEPYCEKDARCPAASVAPTATTPGYAAGYSGVLVPSLPAAATTRTPLLCAYAIASDSIALDSSLPRLRLMTSASWSAAQMIPLASASDQ